jgi:hypothetical protein
LAMCVINDMPCSFFLTKKSRLLIYVLLYIFVLYGGQIFLFVCFLKMNHCSFFNLCC